MNKGRKTTKEERAEIVAFCIANGKDYWTIVNKLDTKVRKLTG